MTRTSRRRFPILLAAIAALLALFGAPALPSTADSNPVLPPAAGLCCKALAARTDSLELVEKHQRRIACGDR